MQRKLTLVTTSLCAALILAFGCIGGGGGGSGDTESGYCEGGGWCGEESITITADVSGVDALFTMESTGESTLTSESAPLSKATTVSTAWDELYGLTVDGTIKALISATNSSSLPKLSYVAVSPNGYVLLVFEYSFIYTDEVDGVSLADYADPWSPSSPFTCQVFVLDTKVNATGSDAANATCVTNSLEVNTWDARSGILQFDSDDNAYFAAHVPQNWKNVLIKWTPPADGELSQDNPGTLAEVINANICFREFAVTSEGGVLYTGVTSTSGDCNGESFLRYLTPDGALQEITSGWWEYVFKPLDSSAFNVDTSLVKGLTAANNLGQIVFYGPDPELATTPDWDDSCLFKFNPDASGELRSVKIADCNIDVWNYVEAASTLANKKTRCTEEKSMLGGGNIPEKILLADVDGDGTIYELFVVGDIYEKKPGTWKYDVCVDEAHCVNAAGAPLYTYVDNQAGCAAAGNTWFANWNCYNQTTDSTAYTALLTVINADKEWWHLNGQWCESPGGDWRNTYSAFALVDYSDGGTTDDEDDDTSVIYRLTSDTEVVKNGWVIDNRLIYSSFIASGADSGTYKLREIVFTDDDTTAPFDGLTAPATEFTIGDLFSGYEVYELFRHPNSTDDAPVWFFNGLRFSDNQYINGKFSPDAADVTGSIVEEETLTGQIETLVVLPTNL